MNHKDIEIVQLKQSIKSFTKSGGYESAWHEKAKLEKRLKKLQRERARAV